MVQTTSLALTGSMPTEYFARNAGSLPVLLKEHNVQLHMFPEDAVYAMYRISDKVVAEGTSGVIYAQRIHASWPTYRQIAMAYQPYSTLSFGRNRGKNLAT